MMLKKEANAALVEAFSMVSELASWKVRGGRAFELHAPDVRWRVDLSGDRGQYRLSCHVGIRSEAEAFAEDILSCWSKRGWFYCTQYATLGEGVQPLHLGPRSMCWVETEDDARKFPTKLRDMLSTEIVPWWQATQSVDDVRKMILATAHHYSLLNFLLVEEGREAALERIRSILEQHRAKGDRPFERSVRWWAELDLITEAEADSLVHASIQARDTWLKRLDEMPNAGLAAAGA